MTYQRVAISPDARRALQIEAAITGETIPATLERLILTGISQKAKDALIAIGETSATAKKPKSDKAKLTQRRSAKKPPLLDSDSRKEKLIEMVKQPETPTLEEMGGRLGGYDKAAVSRAISRLRESGELEGEGGEESTS